jgi:hypothetical protein
MEDYLRRDALETPDPGLGESDGTKEFNNLSW